LKRPLCRVEPPDKTQRLKSQARRGRLLDRVDSHSPSRFDRGWANYLSVGHLSHNHASDIVRDDENLT
jgi:hypothetical protein